MKTPIAWGTWLAGIVFGIGIGQTETLRHWLDGNRRTMIGWEDNPLILLMLVAASGLLMLFVISPLIDWLDGH